MNLSMDRWVALSFVSVVLTPWLSCVSESVNPTLPTHSTPFSTPNHVPQANLPVPAEVQKQLADARSVSKAFAYVAAQVGPSVVSIRTQGQVVGQTLERNPHCILPPNLERLLQSPMWFRFVPRLQLPCNPYILRNHRQEGAGSGVLIDEKNGYVLTNNHVISEAETILVVFSQQPNEEIKIKARVQGRDPFSDLAVLKLEGNLWKSPTRKAAILGDSDEIQQGDWVLAIGNPFGFDHTLTAGVISAKERPGFENGRGKLVPQNLLQTDASINPGNSGGPLINLQGEVIGINTAIYGPGSSIGIGFAIPSNVVKTVAHALIKSGKLERSTIGVLLAKLPARMRADGKEGAGIQNNGVLVTEVQPHSPAERAGIQPNDILLDINGTAAQAPEGVNRLIQSIPPRTLLTITLLRKNQYLTVSVRTIPLLFEEEGKEETENEETDEVF